MPAFVRAFQPGGTFFFTVVTYHRRPIYQHAHARAVLRHAIVETQRRRPFNMPAVVLLPNHLHALWTLPDNDADFSTRWRKIKEAFTRAYLDVKTTDADGRTRARGSMKEAEVTVAQARKGLRGVWQPRFWEHMIRDDEDYRRHVDYIHYNPVKHGLCRCPHEWEWSSFRRWVAAGVYDENWCCYCKGGTVTPPDFGDIERFVQE